MAGRSGCTPRTFPSTRAGSADPARRSQHPGGFGSTPRAVRWIMAGRSGCTPRTFPSTRRTVRLHPAGGSQDHCGPLRLPVRSTRRTVRLHPAGGSQDHCGPLRLPARSTRRTVRLHPAGGLQDHGGPLRLHTLPAPGGLFGSTPQAGSQDHGGPFGSTPRTVSQHPRAVRRQPPDHALSDSLPVCSARRNLTLQIGYEVRNRRGRKQARLPECLRELDWLRDLSLGRNRLPADRSAHHAGGSLDHGGPLWLHTLQHPADCSAPPRRPVRGTMAERSAPPRATFRSTRAPFAGTPPDHALVTHCLFVVPERILRYKSDTKFATGGEEAGTPRAVLGASGPAVVAGGARLGRGPRAVEPE